MIIVTSMTMIIANEHWNWLCIQTSYPMTQWRVNTKKSDQCSLQQWTINEVTFIIEKRKRQVYHWFIIDEINLNPFKIIFRWSLKIKGDADTKRVIKHIYLYQLTTWGFQPIKFFIHGAKRNINKPRNTTTKRGKEFLNMANEFFEGRYEER